MTSAKNWATRTTENFKTVELLKNIPLNKPLFFICQCIKHGVVLLQIRLWTIDLPIWVNNEEVPCSSHYFALLFYVDKKLCNWR